MAKRADISVEARPGRPRDPGVVDRAIEAALTIYSSRGLAGLSFDQVARKASVGKAALYSRWATVEELLIEGLRRIAPPPNLKDSGSLRVDLRQLTLMVCDLYSGPNGRVVFRLLLDFSIVSELRPYYDEFVTTYVAASRSIVQRGIRRGDLAQTVDPALLLEQLFGATMLHVLFFTAPEQPLPIASASAYADRLVERVLAGLDVPADE